MERSAITVKEKPQLTKTMRSKNISLSLAMFTFLVSIAIISSNHYKSSNMLVLFLLLSYFSSVCIFLTVSSKEALFKRVVKATLSSAVGAIILEFLTLAGSKTLSPLSPVSWTYASVVTIFFGILCLRSIEICFAPIRRLISALKKINYQDAAVLVVMSFGSALLFSFIGSAFGLSKVVIFAAAIPITAIFALCIVEKREVANKPELVGFILIMMIGLSIISVFPVTNLLTWDDEVHYRNASDLSYIVGAERSKSDRMIIELFHMEDGFSLDASLGKYPVDLSSRFSRDDVAIFSSEVDDNDQANSVDFIGGVSNLTVSRIGYIASASGLWIGRLFNLPFSIRFILGKIFNLLMYATVCSIAIRVAPCKKYILLAISLIPSSVFMASSYSYDPCVTSFTLLGFALLLRIISSGSAVNSRDYWAALIAFAIGFSSKAIYFPLFGIFLIIPKKKYSSDSQRRSLLFLAFIMCVIIILSFVCPYLSDVATNTSDIRGGSDVSTTGQTLGVFEHPFETVEILINFVFGTMLSPSFLSSISTNLAYLGEASSVWSWYSYFPIILFVVICCADNSKDRVINIGAFKRTLVGVFITVTLFLIALALYIAFTGVGSNTVAGVQPRYLIPLLIPFACLIFNSPLVPIESHLNKLRCFMLAAPCVLLYSEMALLLYSRFL